MGENELTAAVLFLSRTGVALDLAAQIASVNRRERIATAALQGMLAEGEARRLNEREIAVCAISFADALIAALDAPPAPKET